MGNAQGILMTEEQIKELLAGTIFDFQKSFYEAYKDSSNLQQMREQYQAYEANLSRQDALYQQNHSDLSENNKKNA